MQIYNFVKDFFVSDYYNNLSLCKIFPELEENIVKKIIFTKSLIYTNDLVRKKILLTCRGHFYYILSLSRPRPRVEKILK